MKAWWLSIKDSDEGNFLVFANTRNEAKSQADSKDLFYDNWIEIEAVRAKSWDDKDSLPENELMKEGWRDGWRWNDYYDLPDPDTASDEEFYEWYDAVFGVIS